MDRNSLAPKASRKIEPRRSAGRPSPFKPEFVAQARKLCALGAIDIEIADFFKVNRDTLFNWKRHHPEFARAMKFGKRKADERVLKSLYHRAIGYSYDAVKVFCNKDGVITRVRYRAHIPPDPASIIFWLKNRLPREWRDRTELEINCANYFIKDAPFTREEWEKSHLDQHSGPDRYLGAPSGPAASAC
jgi:hypothetical protein